MPLFLWSGLIYLGYTALFSTGVTALRAACAFHRAFLAAVSRKIFESAGYLAQTFWNLSFKFIKFQMKALDIVKLSQRGWDISRQARST